MKISLVSLSTLLSAVVPSALGRVGEMTVDYAPSDRALQECTKTINGDWYAWDPTGPREMCGTSQAGSTCLGGSKTTDWMQLEPGECAVLPFDHSGCTGKACGNSGYDDLGLLLNGWVHVPFGSGDAYQHECFPDKNHTYPDMGPIAVDYITKKHKVSVTVTGMDFTYGCSSVSGGWWRDDKNCGTNPLYDNPSIPPEVVIRNNGNDPKTVRLYTRCNFSTCKGKVNSLCS